MHQCTFKAGSLTVNRLTKIAMCKCSYIYNTHWLRLVSTLNTKHCACTCTCGAFPYCRRLVTTWDTSVQKKKRRKFTLVDVFRLTPTGSVFINSTMKQRSVQIRD